jgi:hypothetical protein
LRDILPQCIKEVGLTQRHLIRFSIVLVALYCCTFLPLKGQGSYKTEKKDGHVSPVSAKVTFTAGNSRTVLVLGFGQPNANFTEYYTHIFKGTGEGNSAVTIYLDTIQAIRETTEQDALFVMKSGTERRLAWINELGMGGPSARLRALVVANPDGPPEKIDLAAIKSVEFL